MEALTTRMKRLELEGRIVILQNQLWDAICSKSSTRHTVEVSWKPNGTEATVGELRVPTFYFMNERKFSQKIQQLLRRRYNGNNGPRK